MADLENILQSLTLEEKCALCSGVTNWRTACIKDKNVPSVMVADGPHGIRKELVNADVANFMQDSEPSTCFPTAVTVASTWDTEIAYKMGQAIAEEAVDQGVDVVLGPGVNIKRNPLCGRNFEYFSEDPYLAGEMGASYVNGVQSKKVGTSLKHYAVNSQEHRRMTISSEVDERALREIYLPAFENTVKKAQPYTIMCSYNPVNGVHASDNKMLLTDILREEWGYNGIVVSDWGAVNDRVKGILAGLDLEMPTSNGIRDKEIFEAVKSGKITEADLDKVVIRLLDFAFRCQKDREERKDIKADYDKNFDLACEIAEKGAVLLKNEGILPLQKDAKIAVIGNLAKKMRYQGSGSSRIHPKKLTSFTDYLDELKADYAYADGYDPDCDEVDKAMLSEAVKIASEKEVVLLFIGLTDNYESEGFDRSHMDLPMAHNALVEEISKVNKNLIVVLSGGSAMAMPWLNKVSAVLNMYLCGCAGGKACYRLLYGEANPCGKLAETFPISLKDNPAYLYFQMGPQTVEYRESIFVGYRYFDTAKKQVRFPFGYGLSYTTFAYSDLKLSAEAITDSDKLEVSFAVTNTGKIKGAEIAQVYVKDVESTIFREEKALKAFAKVELEAGETKTVTVTLDKRSFAFYNTEVKDWTVESGAFEILVGASSRDIKLNASINVASNTKIIPSYKASASCYYNIGDYGDIPDKDFRNLLGRDLVDNVPLAKGDIDYNACLGDLGVCWIGKLLKWAAYTFSAKIMPKDSPQFIKKMAQKSALSMPLRNAFAMTNGLVPQKVVDGLVKRCNGKPFQGIGMIIGGFLAKKGTKKIDLYRPNV